MRPMSGSGQRQGGGRRADGEARLADKLRQNLVRRKAKARAMRDAARSGAGGDMPTSDVQLHGASAAATKERQS
jgi:hypothetical protein